MHEFDVAIVGAGLVGLATAYQLLSDRPDLRLVVVDKEQGVARHQSSHNSGVLHSGVYYTPGSLKSRLCREGKAAVEAFARERGIPYETCGKVIVAIDESELGRLDALHERAVANGVPGVRLVGPAELRDIEPHCAGVRALVVPGTGIIDFARVAAAYATTIQDAGAELYLGRRVETVAELTDRVVLVTEAGDISAATVVTCAGLYSDRFGRRHGPALEDERIVPFRGDYYTLTPAARHLCRSLIYPVPDPTLPFLGVHFTKRIDGEVWAGPNAVLATSREGYARRNVRPVELADTLTYPGFLRLARKYWRTGASEVWRDVSKHAFLRSLQRYVPEVSAKDLVWGPSGVRAQAVRGDGVMVDDFSIIRGRRSLHVRNAPSPGATASLAIGRYLADMALEAVGGATRHH